MGRTFSRTQRASISSSVSGSNWPPFVAMSGRRHLKEDGSPRKNSPYDRRAASTVASSLSSSCMLMSSVLAVDLAGVDGVALSQRVVDVLDGCLGALDQFSSGIAHDEPIP